MKSPRIKLQTSTLVFGVHSMLCISLYVSALTKIFPTGCTSYHVKVWSTGGVIAMGCLLGLGDCPGLASGLRVVFTS